MVEKKSPKYKLFKNGALRISCPGSGLLVWVGNKYYPVSEADIPGELKKFCDRCGKGCEGKRHE